MGTVSDGVRVVALEDVDRIDLDNDSWSRMVLTEDTVPNPESSLGYSLFTPGTVTDSVSHEVEELALVLSGEGELRLDDDVVTIGPMDGLFIAPNTWHQVSNTGDEDLLMVFCFSSPTYPPTDRR